jgi:hypothetical protein
MANHPLKATIGALIDVVYLLEIDKVLFHYLNKVFAKLDRDYPLILRQTTTDLLDSHGKAEQSPNWDGTR